MITKISDTNSGDIYNMAFHLKQMNENESKSLANDIDELNLILLKSGVRLTLNNAGSTSTVVLSYVNNIAKRNAGRKKTIGEAKTVAEIYNFRKNHTSIETAAYAGIGIRTYQRRVKKYKSLSRWHEDNHNYF